MLSLREWIDGPGARYASHIERIVKGPGYDAVDGPCLPKGKAAIARYLRLMKMSS